MNNEYVTVIVFFDEELYFSQLKTANGGTKLQHKRHKTAALYVKPIKNVKTLEILKEMKFNLH